MNSASESRNLTTYLSFVTELIYIYKFRDSTNLLSSVVGSAANYPKFAVGYHDVMASALRVEMVVWC